MTRPAGRGRTLRDRLILMGAEVSLRPTIAFTEPLDTAMAEQAVRDASGFDWIVFTSATGVKAFAGLSRTLGVGEQIGKAGIAAIGPATAAALSGEGFKATLTARRNDAVGLAGELAVEIRPGDTVLVVKPELSGRELPEALADAGAEVREVPFYRTVPADDCGEIAAEIAAGNYDSVVFTSPSTLQCLLQSVGRARGEFVKTLASLKTVAIGSVTAAAMHAEGVVPGAVADAPTDSSIADAVVRLLRS